VSSAWLAKYVTSIAISQSVWSDMHEIPREENRMRSALRLSFLASLAAVLCGAPTQAQQPAMTFFITSVGKGNGADLGGLEGADAHCGALAKAAGSTVTNWRAYLSTTLPGGDAGVSARSIGRGPWHNPKGHGCVKNVDDLHSTPSTSPTDGSEREGRNHQRARRPGERARHPDRLGSLRQVFDRRRRHNVQLSKSGDGSAIVGHHDRAGLKTWHMRS
jgi:hypothetical protein